MSDHETTGQALDLDAIEASAKGFVDERQIRRILSRDVPALVAEVRRLRDDREMGRTNLAHYSEIIDAQAGENEQLRRRFRLCSGCDATLARCNEYIGAGAIKCCPDCRHAA